MSLGPRALIGMAGRPWEEAAAGGASPADSSVHAETARRFEEMRRRIAQLDEAHRLEQARLEEQRRLDEERQRAQEPPSLESGGGPKGGRGCGAGCE